MKSPALALLLLLAGCQHGPPWSEAENWQETVLAPNFPESAAIAVVSGRAADQRVVGKTPCEDSETRICMDVTFDVQLSDLRVIAGDFPDRKAPMRAYLHSAIVRDYELVLLLRRDVEGHYWWVTTGDLRDGQACFDEVNEKIDHELRELRATQRGGSLCVG